MQCLVISGLTFTLELELPFHTPCVLIFFCPVPRLQQFALWVGKVRCREGLAYTQALLLWAHLMLPTHTT